MTETLILPITPQLAAAVVASHPVDFVVPLNEVAHKGNRTRLHDTCVEHSPEVVQHSDRVPLDLTFNLRITTQCDTAQACLKAVRDVLDATPDVWPGATVRVTKLSPVTVQVRAWLQRAPNRLRAADEVPLEEVRSDVLLALLSATASYGAVWV